MRPLFDKDNRRQRRADRARAAGCGISHSRPSRCEVIEHRGRCGSCAATLGLRGRKERPVRVACVLACPSSP